MNASRSETAQPLRKRTSESRSSPPPPAARTSGIRFFALLALVFTAAIVLVVLRWPRAGAADSSVSTPGAPRIVSLAPAITETLIALEATDRLVGVSTYCRTDGLGELPRVGTALTPQYESLVRLEPTLILTSRVSGDQTELLSRIAPTRQLPWLTLEEVTGSVRELGELVGRPQAGRALAKRLEQVLSVEPSADAPRVLLAMSYEDTGDPRIWFVRKNSLHGAALRAAGGRNAVSQDVAGQPHLSVEELLRLDPDRIILLEDADRTSAEEAARRLDQLRKLTPLGAVRRDRLGVVRLPNVFSGGPRILDLVEPLRSEIGRLP